MIENIFGLVEKPSLYLCTTSGNSFIEEKSLVTFYDLVEEKYLNDVSKLTFNIPINGFDGNKNIEFDLIAGKKIVKFNDDYYKITSYEYNDDNINGYTSVTCTSLQIEFQDRSLYVLEGLYQIYNSLDSSTSLLNKILDSCGITAWTIGYIEPSLLTQNRYFDAVNATAYSFLMDSVQKAFDCLIIFDIKNLTINAYTLDSIGVNQPIFLSDINVVKKYQKTEKTEEVVTVLPVYGNDDLSISPVNPYGGDSIIDFSYYKTTKYMSQDLIDVLDTYETLLNGDGTTYAGIAQNGTANTITLSASASSVDNFYTDMEIYITNGTGEGQLRKITNYIGSTKVATVDSNWDTAYIDNTPDSTTNYSIQNHFAKATVFQDYLSTLTTLNETLETQTSELSVLQGELTSIKQQINVAQTAGTSYSSLYSQLVSKNSEINSKQSEIDATNSNINNCNDNITYLNSITDIYNNLTSSELAELDHYVFTPNNLVATNYTITDSMTFGEKIDMIQALYDYGKTVMDRLKQPRFAFDISVANFLKNIEYTAIHDKFNLGDIMTVGYKDEPVFTIRLLGYTRKWDDDSNFTLNFGNKARVDNAAIELEELLQNAITTGTTATVMGSAWGKYVSSGERTELMTYISSALDFSKQSAINASNQSFVIDEFGITGRKTDDDGATYYPEQMKITNNVIVFSKDAFQTASLAIGKIPSPTTSGTYVYGVVADAIIGTLVASENLLIQNSGGTFEVNKDGVVITDLDLTVTNSAQTVQTIINPTYPIKIQKGNGSGSWTNVFYADSSGNLNLSATLTASTINGGDINGSNIIGAIITGAIINGGTINVDTDINVGNNVYIGNQGLLTEERGIYYTSGTYIKTYNGISPYYDRFINMDIGANVVKISASEIKLPITVSNTSSITQFLGSWDFSNASISGLSTSSYPIGNHNHGISSGTRLAIVDSSNNIIGSVGFVESGAFTHSHSVS